MPVELIWIEAHYPGHAAVLAGFILLGDGPMKGRSFEVSLLSDWSFVATEEDREVLAGMEEHIRSMLEDDLEHGIKTLQEASNVLRFSDRLRVCLKIADVAGLRHELTRLLLASDSGERSLSASA